MSEATQALATLPAASASAIVKSERILRRDALRSVVDRNPGGKLAAKARLLISDLDQLDEWIAEAGSEDALIGFICARVASGETLREWCESYALDRGLVWSLLSETQERLDRYYRAKEGVAEEYVGDAVSISDEQNGVVKENGQTFDPDVPRDKLRIDTRLKVASMYNRQRYSDKGGGTGGGNITVQIVQFGRGEAPEAIAARVKGQVHEAPQ